MRMILPEGFYHQKRDTRLDHTTASLCVCFQTSTTRKVIWLDINAMPAAIRMASINAWGEFCAELFSFLSVTPHIGDAAQESWKWQWKPDANGLHARIHEPIAKLWNIFRFCSSSFDFHHCLWIPGVFITGCFGDHNRKWTVQSGPQDFTARWLSTKKIGLVNMILSDSAQSFSWCVLPKAMVQDLPYYLDASYIATTLRRFSKCISNLTSTDNNFFFGIHTSVSRRGAQ